MEKFHIVGPTRLAGRVAASGAKNAALPALTASLLSDETLTLRNVPRVRDIRTLRKLLEHLGMESREEDGAIVLRRERPNPQNDAPYDLVKTMRASVLVLGPLLAKEGHARVSLPGGCAIGVRPIDQHLKALTALGAEVTLSHGYVETRAARLTGTRFRFDMPTVTGTENVMMAAALARGTTVLENCAREPEVVDLANLLNAMGARISGAGEETIVIDGVDGLGARRAHHHPRPDRGGHLPDRRRADRRRRAARRRQCRRSGAPAGQTGRGRRRGRRRGGRDPRPRRPQGIAARDLETAPHPGFPTDLQAQYMTLMTCAYGVSTISETIFENRFQHAPELMRMGADIRVDGGRAQVHGPTRLTGAGVMATDLRASACLVLAGIAAEGETVVDRIYHLDRGYEQMELKLQQLGARVARWSVPMGA